MYVHHICMYIQHITQQSSTIQHKISYIHNIYIYLTWTCANVPYISRWNLTFRTTEIITLLHNQNTQCSKCNKWYRIEKHLEILHFKYWFNPHMQIAIQHNLLKWYKLCNVVISIFRVICLSYTILVKAVEFPEIYFQLWLNGFWYSLSRNECFVDEEVLVEIAIWFLSLLNSQNLITIKWCEAKEISHNRMFRKIRNNVLVVLAFDEMRGNHENV